MTNLILLSNQSIVTWRDSGGTEVITLASLATVTGRDGARHDFGTSDRSRRYRWRFFCQFNTAPIVDEVVRIFWKTGDSNAADNDDGDGDVAVSNEDKLNQLDLIGTIIVDEAVLGIEMSVGGDFEFSDRFGNPVIFNGTADSLHATAANNGFDLEPIPPNIQNTV